jgi:hypothetical protein
MKVALLLLIDEELLKILPIVMPSTSETSSSRGELRLFNHEDKDNKIFRNVRNISHIDTPSVPKDLDIPP